MSIWIKSRTLGPLGWGFRLCPIYPVPAPVPISLPPCRQSRVLGCQGGAEEGVSRGKGESRQAAGKEGLTFAETWPPSFGSVWRHWIRSRLESFYSHPRSINASLSRHPLSARLQGNHTLHFASDRKWNSVTPMGRQLRVTKLTRFYLPVPPPDILYRNTCVIRVTVFTAARLELAGIWNKPGFHQQRVG